MTSPDGDRPGSADLSPGQQLRHVLTKATVTLDRRKRPGDFYPLHFVPGWWLTEGGGLADHVIDEAGSLWEIL